MLLGLIFSLNITYAQELYWIGGSGDWNDPAHWSRASGSEMQGPAGQVPDENFDVFFDDFSGLTTGEVITISRGQYAVRNFTVTARRDFTLQFSGVSGSTVEMSSGILIIDPGGELTLEKAVVNTNAGTLVIEGELAVEGDLENNGSVITGSAGLLSFFGIVPSLYTVGNSQMRNLEMVKRNADVTLIGDLAVRNNLDFTGGRNTKLLLNAANLTLEPSATITGAGMQKYVVTNGAGALIKELDASGIFAFPVGNTGGWTPLTADFSGTDFNNASLAVRVNPVPDPNLPPDNMDYLSRYWEVDATNIADYQNTVMVSYLNADVVGMQPLITGASHNGVEWSNQDATGSGNTISVTVNGENATITGFNTIALPVELAAFAAEKVSKAAADLSWSTASEQNPSHFSVERLTGAAGWETIGRVAATGTSQELVSYTYRDQGIPLAVRQQGTVYYRLNMIDFDGSQAYSPIRSIVFSGEAIKLTVYPNPTANLISVVAEEEITTLELFDLAGRRVLVGKTNQLNLEGLPVGSYTLRMEAGGETVTTTVVRGE